MPVVVINAMSTNNDKYNVFIWIAHSCNNV